jgi:predicted small secreted protein
MKKIIVPLVLVVLLMTFLAGCPEVTGGASPPIQVGREYSFYFAERYREGVVQSNRMGWITFDNGDIVNANQVLFIVPR